MAHIPVLLQEVLEVLDIQPNDTVLDATVDGGGHSEAIASLLGNGGTLVGLDFDVALLRQAVERLKRAPCHLILREANFRNLDAALDREGIPSISKALFDLGLSSEHFEQSGRGFSFQRDEPLLMTYSPDAKGVTFTARDILNTWSEEHLVDILLNYGEEQFARRIARKIVETRKQRPIEYTQELADVILSATPRWYHRRKIHPATKTFQALRMTVNDEVNALREGLAHAFHRLDSGGRIAVIAFHSVEDRIVKNIFREWVKRDIAGLIAPKPIVPTREEMRSNPRARSAKLRAIRKLSPP